MVDKLLARGKRVLVVLPAVYVASSGRIPNNVGSATTWREKSADDEVCTSSRQYVLCVTVSGKLFTCCDAWCIRPTYALRQ